MKSRTHGFGLGAALSLAAFCLSFTAHAQGPETPAEKPADPVAPTADAEADKPKEAEPPKEEAPQVERKEEGKVEAPTTAPPPATTKTPEEIEREKSVQAVGVERLPGSAYPEPYTRGIVGGSLWLTLHGYQWPYMPAIGDKASMRLGLSGSVWNDLSYAHIVSGRKKQEGNRKRWASQGRAVLRLTPTYSTADGWFAQGQAELVANGDTTLPTDGTTASTDDLYVRFGKWDLFDITVGRYQGWEVFHFGMGLDLNTLEREGARVDNLPTPPPLYSLSYFWDRQNLKMGNYAAHIYPTKYLRFEILGGLGAGVGGIVHSANFRPVGILDFGIVKLKAGFEYGKAIPTEIANDKGRLTRNGWGAAAQFVLNPYIEGGFNYAIGYEDRINPEGVDDLGASNTTWGLGGFINGRVYKAFIVGGGLYQFHWENLRPDGNAGPNFGRVDSQDQTFAYAALQYSFWDSIFFKLVGAHEHQKVHDFSRGDLSNKALSLRFRAMVLF